jgi:hypothetical protein
LPELAKHVLHTQLLDPFARLASTPDVFDPWLPFTRSHATTRVGGSQRRMNRSPKHLFSSPCAPIWRRPVPVGAMSADARRAVAESVFVVRGRESRPHGEGGQRDRAKEAVREVGPEYVRVARCRVGAAAALPTFSVIR